MFFDFTLSTNSNLQILIIFSLLFFSLFILSIGNKNILFFFKNLISSTLAFASEQQAEII